MPAVRSLSVPSERRSDRRLPLEGIRIIDMTIIWAGPFGSMLLADLGAEVIRVESLQFFPRTTRGWVVRPTKEQVRAMNVLAGSYVDKDPGERPWNRNAVFNVSGRNKLSMTADLRRPEGVEIFKRLAAISDIVMDNNSFGLLNKLGIGYNELTKVNKGIIVISMPLFGNTGSYREMLGTGGGIDIFSGFTSLRGYRDPGADPQTTTHMDATSGAGSAFAVLCALRHRRRTGKGQFIDFSQLENMLHQAGEYFLDSFMNGRSHQNPGNRDDMWGTLQGCYECKTPDTWLVLTIRDDADWARLKRALGQPAWMEADAFNTTLRRLENQDAFDHHVREWTAGVEAEEAMHALQREGIPAAKVMNEADVYRDPYYRERGFFLELNQSDCGTHLYPGHLWKASGTKLRADAPHPNLGEHNPYVYQQLLGYSDQDYERLVEEKHIGDAFVV